MKNELALRKENLPATIEELQKFILITRERINAHRAQINAIKRLGLSKTVYEQKLKEAQFMGEAVLWAEVKMGKLLKKIPRAKGGVPYQKKYSTSSNNGTSRTELQKTGIGKTDRMRAQILADNEEAVEEVIGEEINKGNIPTREKVLRKVREVSVEEYRNSMRRKGKNYNISKDLPIVIHDDFYEYCMNRMKPNSVDHIITDPPYPEKYLPLWSKLSKVANRVLKPSGFCICYTGEYYLPEVINMLREYLTYYWLICIKLSGAHNIVRQRNIYKGFRTVLIFCKKPIKKQRLAVYDFIEDTGGMEKELHEWQQSVYPFRKLLNSFTEPGQLILEPFAGSGTTGIACMIEKRRCIMIEKDRNSISIIRGRLKETLEEIKRGE